MSRLFPSFTSTYFLSYFLSSLQIFHFHIELITYTYILCSRFIQTSHSISIQIHTLLNILIILCSIDSISQSHSILFYSLFFSFISYYSIIWFPLFLWRFIHLSNGGWTHLREYAVLRIAMQFFPFFGDR
jgi:hypothetical protein